MQKTHLRSHLFCIFFIYRSRKKCYKDRFMALVRVVRDTFLCTLQPLKIRRSFVTSSQQRHHFRLLYWMDEDSHSIRRVPISYSASSTSESTAVLTGLSKPFHFVLDVLGRAMYWTCLDSDSINATTIDNTSSTGVVVRGENMMPRHLALHQSKR